MQRPFFFALAALTVLLLGTQVPQAEPIIECIPKGNARPICGFSNPEDIVALPGDQAILIGEYGASAEATGRLLVLELLQPGQPPGTPPWPRRSVSSNRA